MSTPSLPTVLVLLALVGAAACTSDSSTPLGPPPPPPPPPPNGECRSASDLESCLPAWRAFAPAQTTTPPTPDNAAVAPVEVVEAYERIDEAGNTVNLGDVTFSCSSRTYNFLDNPSRAVSFNLDETVVWPGALVQGRTHRDGAAIGDLLELPIRERAPLSVTVSFNNQDNTRTIDAPDAGTVRAAIGSMIGNAQGEGLATATNIDFTAETYSSERQAAQKFGFSGRYVAFEATASGSLERSATTNTVAAKFVQQMFVAGVTQPSTPAAFFSSAFTAERYNAQAALGRIGKSNPPLYVSRIGYGRMMVFAMSAKAESDEMQGTLEAAWRGVGASGGASLNARQRAILRESRIRITQVGGDQTNALNAVRTGQLSAYFSNTAPLTSASPLWFELKSLTGEVATVSEPGQYTETTCTPRLPGTFEFQPEQSLAIPFQAGTQRQVVQADVNGDGRMDLVFNERRNAPTLNRLHIALAQSGGGFVLSSPVDNAHVPTEGWESYELLVMDIDGDGRDDLAWNMLGGNNVVYTAMPRNDGTMLFRDRQVHTQTGWSRYTVSVADLNGDGRDDLVWNIRSTTYTRTYLGLTREDSTQAMVLNYVDRNGNYSGYSPAQTGNFSSDRYADVMLNALGAAFNNTYIGRFTPTGTTQGALNWQLVQRPGSWTSYRLLAGDIDGQNADDLIWIQSNTTATSIQRSINNGNTVFAHRPEQSVNIASAASYIGDFNNDGRADLLLNRRVSNGNELMVGFGGSDGDFSFPAGLQTHPVTPGVGWGPFDQVFVGDINGDGKSDIVWTNPSSEARVFVALAK